MGAIERLRLAAPTRRRLTVSDILRMDEAGLFGPEERVELIDGEIIDMATIGSRHAGAVRKLTRLLYEALGGRAIVSVQNPLQLGEHGLPQPDLVVCRPRGDDYTRSHPTAADALLVIEVADSSARFDREIKLPLYAKHGVPEVWIVDLDAGLVRFYRRPQDDSYADASGTATPGVTLLPELADTAIDLAGVLG